MQQTPFHAYYLARQLESLPEADKLLPVFASSDIRVYPFQVAAADFALRSPYQRGAVLCDEAGMGKSYEAMLVIGQYWQTGKTRVLICIPNGDLLLQWVELIERYYSLPAVVVNFKYEMQAGENPFQQEGIVLSTYDYVAEHEEMAAAVSWDLTVFEEATALSTVYQDGSKQARALHRVAGNAFKLLLTGTPIEKNIMDLYGLIWFIDNEILPDEQSFLRRYLRRPEHYPELAGRVSPYCFRTLRAQAKRYAKVPRRLLVTCEYTLSEPEQELYDRLYSYCQKPNKLAFPEMKPYDLTLRVLDLQGSSTAAILQTLRGVIKRLESTGNAGEELAELRQMERLAAGIEADAKLTALLTGLEQGFKRLGKTGAPRKALIFTSSAATQAMLYGWLAKRYRTVFYNGNSGFSAIQAFQADAEILVSTDHGARGFHLAHAAFVIHYDLPYNTLKLEQRIDRCHRLGQQNDVLSLAFIDKRNFADVRKLELVGKRILVADGVLGLSDELIGGFTGNLPAAIAALPVRSQARIEAEYRQALTEWKEENSAAVSAAENLLFTTFTRELAGRVKITPQYVSRRAEELNTALWELVKWYFTKRNEAREDCRFLIDDAARTVTAETDTEFPYLFYYWTGSRNKKYRSLRRYGMAKDFTPAAGRITLHSILGRGILHELECADSGTLTVESEIEPSTVALYNVELACGNNRLREVPLLVGQTHSGKALSGEACEALLRLPVVSYTESGHKAPHWLRTKSSSHELDRLASADALLERQKETLTDAQAEEVERIRLRFANQKAAVGHDLGDLQAQVRALEGQLGEASGNRMKILTMQRTLNSRRQELLKKQNGRFFAQMELDVAMEREISAFLESEKLTTRVVREFVIEIRGDRTT